MVMKMTIKKKVKVVEDYILLDEYIINTMIRNRSGRTVQGIKELLTKILSGLSNKDIHPYYFKPDGELVIKREYCKEMKTICEKMDWASPVFKKFKMKEEVITVMNYLGHVPYKIEGYNIEDEDIGFWVDLTGYSNWFSNSILLHKIVSDGAYQGWGDKLDKVGDLGANNDIWPLLNVLDYLIKYKRIKLKTEYTTYKNLPYFIGDTHYISGAMWSHPYYCDDIGVDKREMNYYFYEYHNNPNNK